MHTLTPKLHTLILNSLAWTLLMGCSSTLFAQEDSTLDAALDLANKEYRTCSANHWEDNPEAPARSKDGRIDAKEFFKRYPTQNLEIIEQGIVPNGDFGNYKPGDQFGNSWLVKATGTNIGINHKSTAWISAVIECMDPIFPTQTLLLKPDRGCGCGGTSDWNWTIPFSAPSGTHKIILRWESATLTTQKLSKEYTVTIINPLTGKTASDLEIQRLEKKYGADKIQILQNGAKIKGDLYNGVTDLSLGFGGYEGASTGIIHPTANTVSIGYWIVNQKASYYARGLFRFDLSHLHGKRVQHAYLKLSIKQNQKYLPPVLKSTMPIYAMRKSWQSNSTDMNSIFVDERGLGIGYPNTYYQAYPNKWDEQLASGASDHSEQIAELHIDPQQVRMPGARADLTALVNDWLSGTQENHGIIIGADLPKELNNVHPGLDGKVDAYKKLYADGAVPFISSDESVDREFSPRLVLVFE